MTLPIDAESREVVLAQLGLRQGQFFSLYRYKNLKWDLNGYRIGFGDLRQSDIEKIQSELKGDEVFTGWNEHHETEWQQTNLPMIRITEAGVTYREQILSEEKAKHSLQSE